jgi:hypothetical protein
MTFLQLLRLKCEAYSTMNDTDEDAEVERRLDERMVRAGGTTPPHVSLVAPAALYLTAILECATSLLPAQELPLICAFIDIFASAFCASVWRSDTCSPVIFLPDMSSPMSAGSLHETVAVRWLPSMTSLSRYVKTRRSTQRLSQ